MFLSESIMEINKMVYGENLVEEAGGYSVGDRVYVLDLDDGMYEHGVIPENLRGSEATVLQIDGEDDAVFVVLEENKDVCAWLSMLEIKLINKKEEE